MRTKAVGLVCLLAFGHILASAPRALAQASTPSGATTETVTLSLENTDIKHLIQWASAYIDKTIIVHPSVQGNITVIAGEPVAANQVGKIFQSVLQVYGFIAVETDNAIKILPDSLSSAAGPDVSDTDSSPAGERIATTVIPIEHAPADTIATKLKPFLTKSATVAVFQESNTLLIADRANSIQRLAGIIQRIDVPEHIEVNVIQLDYSRATDVVARLKEVLPKSSDNAARGMTYAADERTNSILYTGNTDQARSLAGLIKRLDKPTSYNANTQVIFLEYAEAEQIASSLNAIGEGIRKRDTVTGKPDTDIIIEVNKEHNALIITATSAVIDEMKQVISQLDRRRLQVLVEALIVEVNEEDAKDIGIEWRALLDIEGGYAGNSALTKNLSTPELPGIGPGLTLGFLRVDETGLLIRALESSGAANILSKPTIVSLDNEQATILVGSNVPFITGSSTGSASPTDNPFQTITRQDIGITLSIKPQINMNQSITLEIEQKVESLSESVTTTADVVTNKREIKTKVLIEHDEILVLGGLIRDELQESVQGVPVLSDIPFLGRLFRGNTTQVKKSNLMVFIHPRILKDRRDNVEVTGHHYQQIGQDQKYINSKIDRFFVPHDPPDISDERYWTRPEDMEEEAVDPAPTDGKVE